MLLSWVDHRVVIAWLVGIVCYPAVEWLCCKICKKEYKSMFRNKRNVALLLVFALFIAVQLYITHATNQNRECVHRLTTALTTEQQLAKRERDALTTLLFAAVNPPEDIAALPPTDPVRQAWGKDLGNKYLVTIKQIGTERTKNEAVQQTAQQKCG